MNKANSRVQANREHQRTMRERREAERIRAKLYAQIYRDKDNIGLRKVTTVTIVIPEQRIEIIVPFPVPQILTYTRWVSQERANPVSRS